MIPTKERKSKELLTAFMAMVVAITAGITLMTGLLRLLDRLEPQTGDIIAFPAARVTSVSTAEFAVSRAAGPESTRCFLDVQTMQRYGGSLVVESTQLNPQRYFQVHWAGLRTSNDRNDCGASADLLLNSNQISALVFAAGGKGAKVQN